MDRLVNLTKNEFDKLQDMKTNATEASFKIYSPTELLKVYHNPTDSLLEKIEYLIYNYGDKLKTKMPLAPAYVDEEFIGSLLHYFPQAYHFSVLKKIGNLDLKISRLNILKNRLLELCENNLYTTDLHSSNVLLTKEKLEVEIIDIDRNGLTITNSYSDKLYNYVTYEYMKLILEVLFEEYHPILSTSIHKTSEILESYEIDNIYIDHIVNKNTNFAFAKDFLEYVQKNKKLLKKY